MGMGAVDGYTHVAASLARSLQRNECTPTHPRLHTARARTHTHLLAENSHVQRRMRDVASLARIRRARAPLARPNRLVCHNPTPTTKKEGERERVRERCTRVSIDLRIHVRVIVDVYSDGYTAHALVFQPISLSAPSASLHEHETHQMLLCNASPLAACLHAHAKARERTRTHTP